MGNGEFIFAHIRLGLQFRRVKLLQDSILTRSMTYSHGSCTLRRDVVVVVVVVSFFQAVRRSKFGRPGMIVGPKLDLLLCQWDMHCFRRA